ADNRVYYINDTHSEPHWPGLVDDKGDAVCIAPSQTWAVFNDLDSTQEHCGYTPCPPYRGIGVEVVLESFAFDMGPAADAVFLKFTLINKTSVSYSGAYFGLYLDPDVENYFNDVLGSDTLLGLGFCYNGDNTDLAKSVGIDILQGPVVNRDSVDPGTSAKFATNTKTLVYDPVQNIFVPTLLDAGQIWLGATSFVRFASGSAPNNDPETYNLMAGLRLNGTPKTGCGDDNRYAWPGDPVTSPAGCANGVMDPALGGDVRMILNTGPFTFSAGDTQVVWAAVIGATGTNRLSAVAQLKATDALIQTIFDNGLITPKAPSIPKISVTPLDGRIVITWDDVAENEPDTYGIISGITTANGYSANYVTNDFQGYRVYRSRTGLQGSFAMLAQYDLPDGITTVTNRKFSASSNLTIEEVTIGTDNGLRYEYIDSNVVNNHSYYYCVTAYDAQPYIASPNTIPFEGDTIKIPTGIPGTLESDQVSNAVMVRPMKAVLGTTYNAAVDTVAHTGPSDGSVTAEVVDPALVQTGTYSVKFISIPTDSMTFPLVGDEFLPSTGIVYQVWLGTSLRQIGSRSDDPRTFYDGNANGTYEAGVDIKLDESYFGEDQSSVTVEASIIVDGIKLIVSGPANDFKAFNVTANAGGVLNPVAAGAPPAAFNGLNFPTDDPDLNNDQQVNGSFWFMNAATGVVTSDGSYDAYIANAVEGWNQRGWGALVPFDFEIRFTATGQTGQNHGTAVQR
ncbi:hypothetical protein JNL27_04625, partial [bacterium]|nr:hypothetical protein [bacterium]